MQVAPFKIWTQIAEFISNDDNGYAPTASIYIVCASRLARDKNLPVPEGIQLV